MYTEHQLQRVGLSNGQVTSATRRHLLAVSASGLYRNRGLLENGGSWTRNVYRTPIANRGRSIEWSSHFYYASPPSVTVSASGPFQRLRKLRITQDRCMLDEKCLQNTNSQSGSAYRMVKLFPPRGATYWQFPLPVCTKIVDYSTTGTAG
jgi:hypothetical protein